MTSGQRCIRFGIHSKSNLKRRFRCVGIEHQHILMTSEAHKCEAQLKPTPVALFSSFETKMKFKCQQQILIRNHISTQENKVKSQLMSIKVTRK